MFAGPRTLGIIKQGFINHIRIQENEAEELVNDNF